jgi:predicted phosphoadenosine phosphosulfate sulfurtransferase
MSYKENIYGTDRFGELFNKITDYHWAGEPFALIGGVRTEESPTRFVALTQQATYKHVTWGKMLNQKMDHYTFYPIYDWTWQDVWKAIHDHGWLYNEIYNYMYQHGYQIRDMRVSNLHHETAIKHLLFVSQIENHTWSALTKRLDGVNTIKHLDKESMTCPAELPEAFENWIEYRDYLLDHLIVDEAAREKMRNHFANMDKRYEGMLNKNNLTRTQITTIIVNDHHFTKCTNWENNFEVVAWRKWKKHGKLPPVKNQYIHG